MKNKTDRTRKPLKKTALKSIIALVLCMATIIGSIGAGANTASAAKKYPIKLEFNGKSITIRKDFKNDGKDVVTLKKLKKKFGNPKEKKEDGFTEYTWKKGKSYIILAGKQLHIDICDNNGSMYGVKIGMKKSTAIKNIKKALGIKDITFIGYDSDTASLGVTVNSYVVFKKGKVVRISY